MKDIYKWRDREKRSWTEIRVYLSIIINNCAIERKILLNDNKRFLSRRKEINWSLIW